ncbi:porphobilinogen synthase [Leadbetterella byssophila DSM 17132]|jgi:porphobilinogen synthase|uniref:Delta-aminolevulinic acid dehydratase n=1 Tax=Leadbetterella byssophila (strain DSM 17132 / JCM 16389 / KACC 11308 / NBRC 106382 / 4M15) TaxID=649349 RepID=E4RSC1_LEAB4|nr:porphobilinogen synthase [Leadbetterella byssophila]ADQ17657.1 porphobilinogen synthase [Leadbetterella byssophila DSM 17132]
MLILNRRPRRNRVSAGVRDMVAEHSLSVNDFIFPMFVQEGKDIKVEISSMPGIYRFSLDQLLVEIEDVVAHGIKSICLFPNYPESKKDAVGSESYKEGTLYLNALSEIKNKFPELVVMTDVALDPYSSDGHDGIVKDGKILNDESVEVLVKMSVAQAKAGADIIGPSDMMDGRVGAIRQALDAEGFTHTSIMSYTAKYASAFYGPFRDALESAPKFGDKKTYQMNPANVKEAILEAELDFEEGADMLMVKPAFSYLDVIKTLKENFPLPITAYNVSGEYAMIKAAAQNGWIDGDKAMMEMLISMKRAGADIILTYFAKDAARLLS